jgi:hypothetical protein
MRRVLRIVRKIVMPLVVVTAIGVAWLAWRLWPDEKGRIVPIGEQIDTTVLPRFTAALAEAKQITVFEGLPHPDGERSELENERRSKKCVEMHGRFFYDDPRPAGHDDFLSMRQTLLRAGGIVEWGGTKLCGRFHPDYLIRWTTVRGTYDALVCFGCHEIKLFGPRERLYADLSKETYEQLKQTLAGFRKHRPMTE